ncbi:MAG: restriction endonuclease subunit S [Clostridiaceae bacterium]|nr:restriction endonuclease subunit S [Clostridiaceae bacterium]
MSSNGWKEVKMGDVISFNPRESIGKKQMAKKIAMENLKPFTKFIDQYELAPFNGGAKFRNGDTLLARITPCLENGKTSQVTILDNDEIGFGSTEFIVFRAEAGITDKDYIYYLSISPSLREIAIKSMIGSSGRQRVQQRVLKDINLSLPPLSEQKAIAATLSCLDDMIELNNRTNQVLEEMAQAIFKRWFVDFEFPNEDGEPYKSSGGEMVDSELGEIPKGWDIGNLLDIADYLNGLAMQNFRPKENDKTYPVLKIKELRQGTTDSNSELCSVNINQNYIVDDGDLIFSWSGSLIVDFWCGGRCGLNQHLFKVTSNKFDKWYYYYWTNFHLQKFIGIAKDKATTMGHIKREDLKNSKVLIMDNITYQRLNSISNPIFETIIANRIENRKLATIRDTLLPKLMSGEIRVPIEEVV